LARTRAPRRECTQEGVIGKVYAELDERLAKFIPGQPVFFVGPRGERGDLARVTRPAGAAP